MTRDSLFMESDEYYMRLALEAAHGAGQAGEVPVGAVLVDEDGRVIVSASNTTLCRQDPTGHAEINALRDGARIIGNHRLTGATLFVTLEPCAMCAGAISHARIARLVAAADDPKGGAVWHGPRFFDQPTCHWRPDISRGPFAQDAGELLRSFFRARRTGK